MLRMHRTVVGQLALVLAVLGLIVVAMMRTSTFQLNTRVLSDLSGGRNGMHAAETFRQQRDRLSSILNMAKRELAVMSCNMIELNTKLQKTAVSAAGGWCKESSKSDSGQHMFDKFLAEQLSLLFQNQTVASFGDGPGDYKKYLDRTGRLRTYDAFDGAPFGQETSGGVVRFLDLTAPQYGLPVYDWIISLEVAEHIPPQYEDRYIDNIARHANKGLVLSWAVPGQGGLSHVNNRALSYVRSVLSDKGFETDMTASKVLREKASLPWLKQNVYVYRRRFDSPLDPLDA
ncbi:uncharacterized protein [Haliotis cracherodii]|uniref:uncharacterized protein n=1 Tax=Haliotis cracherodii TaxID=6455 RepID=UPI0039EA42D5